MNKKDIKETIDSIEESLRSLPKDYSVSEISKLNRKEGRKSGLFLSN